MTKEQMKIAFNMKVDGCSFDEIGRQLNLSPATIKNTLLNVVNCTKSSFTAYPKLTEFMLEHGYSVKDFSDLIGEERSKVRDFLNGRTKAFEMIAKIINVTGLTFEEIFSEEMKTYEKL